MYSPVQLRLAHHPYSRYRKRGRHGRMIAMEPRPVLRTEDLSALTAAGRTRRYHPGQILFNEGDLSDYVVVIRRGTVKIVAVSGEGYEAVLGVRVAGEIVGDFAALQHRPRSATVVAVDDIEAVQVSGDRFRTFLA